MSVEHFSKVYDDLRRLAAVKVAGLQPGQTLNATALVHEVWLKLDKAAFESTSHSHFLKVAATAMRQILVDRARANNTQKRDGGVRIEFRDLAAPIPDDQILDVNDALNRLAEEKPDHAKLLELRYFAGLSIDETAIAMDISPSTADRMAKYARAWLKVELSKSHETDPSHLAPK